MWPLAFVRLVRFKSDLIFTSSSLQAALLLMVNIRLGYIVASEIIYLFSVVKLYLFYCILEA